MIDINKEAEEYASYKYYDGKEIPIREKVNEVKKRRFHSRS
jgi:hypothetical protein